MSRTFNVAADCKPDEHYMVDLSQRLSEIKKLIDSNKYFTINRARQYGKTTTLRALVRYLQKDYYVVSIDFQTFGEAKFKTENVFALSFASSFLRMLQRDNPVIPESFWNAITGFKRNIQDLKDRFELKELFEELSDLCAAADKQIVLMIDEVDHAADNQVFLDFLAQLRAYYIDRDLQPTFQSVILASVYDIKNLKGKIHSDKGNKVNSPWNIAADFKIEMSFSKDEIAGMLFEYEEDHHTGMDINQIAQLLFDYTSGYPFLVSRLCKLMDEEVGRTESFSLKNTAWTNDGFHEALRILLAEKNSLFESLIGKLTNDSDLNSMLKALLFTGKDIVYNADLTAIDQAEMFGFIKNQNGSAVIANRIFEIRIYNFYLSDSRMQNQDIYIRLLCRRKIIL